MAFVIVLVLSSLDSWFSQNYLYTTKLRGENNVML